MVPVLASLAIFGVGFQKDRHVVDVGWCQSLDPLSAASCDAVVSDLSLHLVIVAGSLSQTFPKGSRARPRSTFHYAPNPIP